MARHEPEVAARAAAVVLPHDWITHLLRADKGAGPTTDRGDASGTGYWSPATGSTAPTSSGWRSAATSRCPGSPGRPRSSARPRAARCSPPAPGTTWRRRSASACAPATSWCRWAPPAPCSACARRRWPTAAVPSPDSPTRAAGTCRWSAR
ncbi:hypothetical protein [Dactylosporangium darangshiense]|uniref:hypothetical protein n=1 Tax=Dactylosporangium darangshiense TaxID=579108 RepID=UPI00363843D1